MLSGASCKFGSRQTVLYRTPMEGRLLNFPFALIFLINTGITVLPISPAGCRVNLRCEWQSRGRGSRPVQPYLNQSTK